MSQEKIYFKERRCFVQNLSFDVEYQQLKDLLKDEAGIVEEPFVQIIINPEKKKPSGGAMIEFQNLDDVDRALKLDGQEKFGRKFIINKESREDDFIKRFCKRNNWSVTLDKRGRARVERSNGMDVDTIGRQPMSSSGANVCTKKKDRRVFIHNMSYDVQWGELKDHLKDNGTEGGFVDFLKKEDGSPAGAAVVDFKTEEEVENAIKLDSTDFKGRKLFVNLDSDCFHLRRWCDKHGFEFTMDGNGNKISIRKRGSTAFQSAPVNHGPPPPSFGSAPQTVDGKPLITDIPDLLKNHLFVSNLSFETREGYLKKHFSKVAYVRKAEIFTEKEGEKEGKSKGMALIEFDRARDAHRAVIMMHDSEIDGRRIRCRASNDRRDLPEGLSELGRPAPETTCIDMCRSKGLDPYAECTVFMANAPFDMQKEEMLEVFRLVGDCFHADLFKKGGRNSGVGVAKFRHAYDAQQAINVLNESNFKGRKLAVRYDNEPRDGGRPQPPPQSPVYGQQPYGARSAPAPNFGQTNGYSAPPMASPTRAPQPSGDTNEQVQQLANLLGIDGATLNAIRIMKSGQAPVEPKRETYTANDTYRSRDRSPHRDTRRDERDTYGYNRSYNRQPEPAYNRQPEPQAQAQVKTENKNWNPITNDTIYIRNLPPSMNENQLRYLFNQCGQISFMDFPQKSDGAPVGYSYIRFDGPDSKRSSEAAVDRFNMFNCDGSKLEVGLY